MEDISSTIKGFNDEKDTSLSIALYKGDTDGSLIVNLSGYIDTYNSVFFQNKLNKIFEAGYKTLYFNCARLNYVSSTGIGTFTSALKSLKKVGGDMALYGVQPKVYEVFQLLGFSQFFNMAHSYEEAIQLLNKKTANVSADIFPKIFTCPICSTKLKAPRPGRFRCSSCKGILAVEPSGHVILG